MPLPGLAALVLAMSVAGGIPLYPSYSRRLVAIHHRSA